MGEQEKSIKQFPGESEMDFLARSTIIFLLGENIRLQAELDAAEQFCEHERRLRIEEMNRSSEIAKRLKTVDEYSEYAGMKYGKKQR